MTNIMPNIKHFVYLMLENRSFDNVLGWLYDSASPPRQVISGPASAGLPFQGLAENTYYNCFSGDATRHYAQRGTSAVNTPDPDPHEPYLHVNVQLFGDEANPPTGKTPTMAGFLQDYATAYAGKAGPLCDESGFWAWLAREVYCKTIGQEKALQIMETYSPGQLPVINGLAKAFAASDLWFSSVPTQTNANRAFSVCGTSMGWTDNRGVLYGLVPDKFNTRSIWNVLAENGHAGPGDWMIYHQNLEAFFFSYAKHAFNIPDANNHVAGIDSFFDAVKTGSLPTFSYLEPAWFRADLLWGNGNSYHPPADVIPGELFLKKLYDALTANPQVWNETLLMITFDEHGGTYDHVPPPWGAAPPWGAGNPPPKGVTLEHGFGFDRFGVRVPTLMVSPWIDEQTIIRSPTDVPFDHTSMIATVLEWQGIPRDTWNLGERVAHAPTFESVLTRRTPRTDIPVIEPSAETKAFLAAPPAVGKQPLTPMQVKMLPVVLQSLSAGKLSEAESNKLVAKMVDESDTADALMAKVSAIAAGYRT